MPTRFLPTHGADAQKKAGWHASNLFSLWAFRRNSMVNNKSKLADKQIDKI